jgi:hydrogenase nickel incorporation protein HypA/HybF
MHELSIAQNIVEIVQQHVPNHGEAKIKTVKLRIGELAGVIPDSLEFCFGAITAETSMQDVILEIERVPFVLECKKCGKVATNETGIFLCMVCGSDDTKMISGNELLVTEIELFDEKEVIA